MKRVLFTVVLLPLSFTVFAQTAPADSNGTVTAPKEKEPSTAKTFKKEFDLIQMIQLWDVMTLSRSGGGTADEFRNDISIRRGRTGVKGKLRPDLSFCIILAYDGIGRDKSTAGNGAQNAPDNRDLYLWDAFMTWSPKPMFNITGGYFRPQVGRENITAAFKVISFEKALTNFQPRTHLLFRSTGRETGVNVGGLHLGEGWSFNYNVGMFDLTSDKILGTGKYWSPLMAGRVAFTLGDAEMDAYKINYDQSFYGKRNGVTIAANGCYTGRTEIFTASGMYGVDILANYGNWDFNAEYDWLYRNTIIDSLNNHFTADRVYSVRLGYNYKLKNGKILQTTVMYSGQIGNDYGATEHLDALTGAADLEVFDVGINYLLNKDNLKLNLHYIFGKNHQMADDPDYSYIGAGFQFLY